MLILLTGLLETGVPRKDGVLDSRRTLHLVKGVDALIRLTILEPSGARHDLTGGSPAVIFTVKKRSQDQVASISRAGTVNPQVGPGVVDFTVTPGDTRLMLPSLFVFDIWLTQNGKRDPVYPLSSLRLEATVAPVP